MDVFAKIAIKIIQEQEIIIGPIALEQAQKVPGLSLNWSKKEVKMQGDERNIVDKLVEQYKHLFGKASVEVCKDAAKEFVKEIPKEKLPAFLS